MGKKWTTLSVRTDVANKLRQVALRGGFINRELASRLLAEALEKIKTSEEKN
jgi:hypothetical protein